MWGTHHRSVVSRIGVACLWLCCVSSGAYADGFAFFRYDDDFKYLSDPSKRVSWYDETKYIPLGDDATHYLSIGADLRERVESYSDGYFRLADAPHTRRRLNRVTPARGTSGQV